MTLLEARVAADGGIGASGEPLGVAPLLVEAYLGLGRTDDARSLAARYAEATPPGSPALSVALARRCQALTVADEATAEATVAAALTAHAEGGDPFETARTQAAVRRAATPYWPPGRRPRAPGGGTRRVRRDGPDALGRRR